MPNPKGKKKATMWFIPATFELVDNNYKKDGCRSKSQYIERAIEYYTGHVNAQRDTSYLPNAILSNLKAIVDLSDMNQNRVIFKLAVELAMVENILAAVYEIDPDEVEKLRGDCVQVVKRTYGGFKFEDAAKWQSRRNNQ